VRLMAGKGAGIQPVNSLAVLLTSGCNLDCRYCYRRNDSTRSLAWPDLRESLDWALAAPGGELEVIFSGGEPLLEFDLLSRAVSHLENRHRAGLPVKIRMLTNGVLMDNARLDFLARNSVHVNLSFDGIREAQSQRGAGTWGQLDRLLGLMHDRHPHWFATHLLVTMTLTPRSLPYLADSVAYLVGRNVETIGVSPALAQVPNWNDDLLDDLDKQLARVFNHGIRLFEETDRVAFVPFRKYQDADIPPGPGRRTCAALEPGNPVLDVDGHLYSCLLFAPSGLDSTDRRLVEIGQDIDLGRASSPGFEERRRSFADGIRNKEVFTSAPDLESVYGKCRDCPASAVCKICPISLLEFGQEEAPKIVPSLLCAYYYLIAKYFREFPVQEDPNPPRVTVESIREKRRYWAQVNN